MCLSHKTRSQTTTLMFCDIYRRHAGGAARVQHRATASPQIQQLLNCGDDLLENNGKIRPGTSTSCTAGQQIDLHQAAQFSHGARVGFHALSELTSASFLTLPQQWPLTWTHKIADANTRQLPSANMHHRLQECEHMCCPTKHAHPDTNTLTAVMLPARAHDSAPGVAEAPAPEDCRSRMSASRVFAFSLWGSP